MPGAAGWMPGEQDTWGSRMPGGVGCMPRAAGCLGERDGWLGERDGCLGERNVWGIRTDGPGAGRRQVPC